MSESQYPHEPAPGVPTGPWGAQPPAMGPYAAPGVTGVPMGPQAPWVPQPQAGPGPTIESFRAPRASRGALMAVAALLGFLAVAFGAFLLRPAPIPGAPAATGSPRPAATASVPGMPFSMPLDPDSTGTWEILDRQWTDEGVSVHVRVTALTGRCSYGFLAFGKGSTDITHPGIGTQTPQLRTGTLDAGQSAIGYVFIPVERGDAMLVLTTSLGRQISALPVAG